MSHNYRLIMCIKVASTFTARPHVTISLCMFKPHFFLVVIECHILVAISVVTWNVLSQSEGHEFKPRSGRTWGAWYFCPNVVLEPKRSLAHSSFEWFYIFCIDENESNKCVSFIAFWIANWISFPPEEKYTGTNNHSPSHCYSLTRNTT